MATAFELRYWKSLKVFIYNPESEAGKQAAELIKAEGHSIVAAPDEADIALAPLLTQKLSKADYSAPLHGTLIFHPSLLPRHRGPDAIKWAYKCGETYTGVTWFWCSEGYDAGDICEQEVLPIDLSVRPGEFYQAKVLPAMLRTLQRALTDIRRGIVRRIPQVEEAATYESKIAKVRLISAEN